MGTTADTVVVTVADTVVGSVGLLSEVLGTDTPAAGSAINPVVVVGAGAATAPAVEGVVSQVEGRAAPAAVPLAHVPALPPEAAGERDARAKASTLVA